MFFKFDRCHRCFSLKLCNIPLGTQPCCDVESTSQQRRVPSGISLTSDFNYNQIPLEKSMYPNQFSTDDMILPLANTADDMPRNLSF